MSWLSAWCLILASILTHVWSLRLDAIIVPPYVLRGDLVLLKCEYDLEEDSLYSATWYKDHEEFYRYVPKSSPSQHRYNMEGITVDLKLSDSKQVLLKNVSLKTSGLYRCEVSAEAPSFTSVSSEAKMEVIALPQEPPQISGEQKVYQVGDIINLNCTSAQSFPPARLRWYVNDIQVGADYETVLPPPAPHSLLTTVAGLRLRVAAGHFSDGRLQVRCVATITTAGDTVGGGGGGPPPNLPAPAPAPVQQHRLAPLSTLQPPLDYNKEALFLVTGSCNRGSAQVILLAATTLLSWLIT
ncbi:hypothetical protein LSTR_LSTR000890 [Laodelphax striatellus]|uniref:Ig-like domain-containing protein n=1 Tax=Laodelphax striatellus TaxID=195883 RepID=A0A482X0N1_LAOST|nr:hypothetical protein LSTR_LSTR000890 [Laodelphax striatellus]